MASATTLPPTASGATWLAAKLRALHPPREQAAALRRAVLECAPEQATPLFRNTFTLDDLAALDDETLGEILAASAELTPALLGSGLADAPDALAERFTALLPSTARPRFQAARREGVRQQAASEGENAAARQRVLDAYFWELTYWRTPALYEELTAGELPHPGIFARLGPEVRGAAVTDVGAGAGRATFAALTRGAAYVWAIEPSPGLRSILSRKLATRRDAERVEVLAGRFEALPLPDAAVDVALACSAFTALPEQGGEAGLAELRRVTRRGGRIVVIWPRPEDYGWLAAHGFTYEPLPVRRELVVRFRSLRAAERCVRRFYAGQPQALRWLRTHHQREIPYRVLGTNPPHDYCWLRV
jgi:ubiquinone/menaquinone biosynthesis C-methylase UbiE